MLLQVDSQGETESRLGPVWPGPIICRSLSKHPPAHLPAPQSPHWPSGWIFTSDWGQEPPFIFFILGTLFERTIYTCAQDYFEGDKEIWQNSTAVSKSQLGRVTKSWRRTEAKFSSKGWPRGRRRRQETSNRSESRPGGWLEKLEDFTTCRSWSESAQVKVKYLKMNMWRAGDIW